MIPLPGLGVDGLAHSAQDAQRLPGVLGHKLVAKGLQRPDGCGRRVQQRHLQDAATFSCFLAQAEPGPMSCPQPVQGAGLPLKP